MKIEKDLLAECNMWHKRDSDIPFSKTFVESVCQSTGRNPEMRKDG